MTVFFSIILWSVFLPNSVTALSKSPPHRSTLATIQKLHSICQHLQNNNVVDWADGASYDLDDEHLVATRDIAEGEIVSLYPVHAVGIRAHEDGGEGDDMIIVDPKIGFGYFLDAEKNNAQYQHDVPLLDERTFPYPTLDEYRSRIFVDVDPPRTLLPGWLGHLATKTSSNNNCAVVPLSGAAPLCALVSTQEIADGQELMVRADDTGVDETVITEISRTIAERYYHEHCVLRTHMNKAYELSRRERFLKKLGKIFSRRQPPVEFLSINRDYPGLRMLHESPDILAIDNFFTHEECDCVIAKARPHLTPCLIQKEGKSAVLSSSRTSTNTNLPQKEVPSLVAKIMNLASNCDPRQLETLQVLRYTRGQKFVPHTDGFGAPTTALGFQHSDRVMTLFVYLNDVPEGGQTRFTKVGRPLDIAPRKGMAVVHFPNSDFLEKDYRTEHEGRPAIDEKWVLVTWVWKHNRTDPRIYTALNDRPLFSPHDTDIVPVI